MIHSGIVVNRFFGLSSKVLSIRSIEFNILKIQTFYKMRR